MLERGEGDGGGKEEEEADDEDDDEEREEQGKVERGKWYSFRWLSICLLLLLLYISTVVVLG